jgi:hypothetical protein
MQFGKTKVTNGWIDCYLAEMVKAMLREKFGREAFLTQVKWIYNKPRDPRKNWNSDSWIMAARHFTVLAREVEVRVSYILVSSSPEERRRDKTARVEFTLTREKEEEQWWVKWDVLRAFLFTPTKEQEVPNVEEDRMDFHFHTDLGRKPNEELSALSDFLRNTTTKLVTRLESL